MRWGRCVVAVCACVGCCVDLAAGQTNLTSIPLVQELSNNTSACSTSTDPGGNQAYCFAFFNGFAANSTDNGAETLMPDPPPGHVSNVPIRDLLYPGWNGRVICEYQPWFGASNHKSVGYSENSAATVAAQDSFMLAVGCDVNLIDFYGALDPNQSFNLGTTNTVFSDLSSRAGYPLKFGIMEDKNALTSTCSPSSTNESATVSCLEQALIAEMDYVGAHYANSGVYFTDAGSPVIFSFVSPEVWPVLNSADWDTIWSTLKTHTDAYTAPFKYIFEFGAFTSAAYDNGRYGWMQPPKFSPTQQFWWGSVTSLSPSYLDTLYSAGIAHPSQLTIGGLWKGFDDNNASWSGNRVIAEQCGQVWLNTASEIGKYFGGSKPQIPYVQVATWNDYEEGTAVEPGIDNCYTVTASLSGSQLSWSLNASDSYATPATVHHFTVYYADAEQNLYTAASNIPATTSTLNLGSIIPPGTWTVYVEMVGQPLIINRMSDGVPFTNGTAKAQLSPASFNFNNQTVGTTSSAAIITLANVGSAAMSINGISISGRFAENSNCRSSLAAGGSCNVSVTFSPLTTGSQTGTLQVSDSAGATPQVVSLSGTGVVPSISFAPAALNFSHERVGTTSGGQTVTLTNAGPGVLTLNGITVAGDFSVGANSCAGAIAVSGSCNFSVAFTPTAAGSRNGSITISSNAPGTNAVQLQGIGVDFGINASPHTQSVAAGNAAAFTISVPSAGASFADPIALTCSNLPANMSCNFNPISVNADATANLTISTIGVQSAGARQSTPFRRALLYAIGLQSSGFGFLGLVLGTGSTRRKRWTPAVCVLALLVVFALTSGCGGGLGNQATHTIPGSPSSTYTVTVVGSAGTLTHSATLTLTVN